ncbi:LysR family transcriptional regulator [Massilia sp. Root351]|uniref:LysR family transcriptional regulator n=1 Tax=Massilia sp. Root351 TaxID=1736522 RepID=UPI00070ED793|nr:LysR family transcriptional regulator [Massilia sp. Root351]KQV78674.1 LysR family transcriptional regulator [Massilia sp. Root351]
MDLLNDMALFVEVAKVLSFRRASEVTGIPNSTLSRRITALEKAIGLRLMHRTTRRIELTEAGQTYFERCKRIVDEARLAHEQLGDLLAQPSGVLRAAVAVDFGITFLAPLLVEFAALYPGLRFELDLAPRNVDLVSEPFDLAIRMGEQPDSTLIARPLARLPGYLYAAPAYLERAGEPAQPHELAGHECLVFRAAKGVWALQRGEDSAGVPVSGRFRLNSLGMVRRLAALGQGIAIFPKELVAEEVASGRLRQILPQWTAPSTAVYAVTATRLLPAKTQRFIEFLTERLRQG